MYAQRQLILAILMHLYIFWWSKQDLDSLILEIKETILRIEFVDFKEVTISVEFNNIFGNR